MAPAKKLLSNQPTTPKLEEEEEPEEEEESSGEGEEESDGEEQKEKPKTPENKASQVKQKPTIVEKHKAACERSGEEEDEEELEEAPNSPSASDFTIKLITPKNPKSKDSKPTSKRPSETSKSDEKELGRKKKAKVNEEDLKKEKSSGGGGGGVVGAGRVWSEEDEIRVLHGMIDYQKKKGVDPSADMAAFHDFVKGKLQAEVTRTQLYEKHRRLKQKCSKNMVKSEKGEGLAFSKPHDTKIYDLSKRVWGVEKISNGVDEIENVNVNGKTDGGKVKKSSKVKAKKDAKVESKNIVKEEVNDDDDEGDFEKKYPFTNEAFSSLVGLIGSHNVSLLKAKLSVVGNATSREFEENWKKLVEQESDIVVKKLRMFADQTERVMDESRRN